MDTGTVLQHRATVLPNIGIIYVLGIIFVRGDKAYIVKK